MSTGQLWRWIVWASELDDARVRQQVSERVLASTRDGLLQRAAHKLAYGKLTPDEARYLADSMANT